MRESGPEGVRARLLLVEDDENQRRLYAQELAEEGYDVIEAGSGEAALAKVNEERPDLVILDISMPGMSGIEVLGKVLGQDRQIPVIINTAYSSYKDNFMSWAADAYLVKSSDLAELKDTVKRVLADRGRRE